MNPDYRDDNSCCYFHPTEVVVGICPLCLNERLLTLSAKHHHHHYHHHHQYKKATTIHLPKIFAFGSLLHRLEFKQSFNNNNNNNKKSHSTFSDNASSSTDQEGTDYQDYCDRACQAKDLAEVAKADWSSLPSGEVEEVNQVKFLPRKQQGGGGQNQAQGLD
ncbi:hypothetical protein ACFE04_025622 [Oxalis oulophora]